MFDRLRRAHFPPERNLIPAHLTLFHHLPGAELAHIQALLAVVCAHQAPVAVQVSGLRSLGRGVAFSLEATAIAAARAALAREWHGWLSAQDRQGWRPHVTIQNKVSSAEAAALLESMRAAFAPFEVRAEGLLLWRYVGGPWEAVGRHAFTGPGRLP